MIAVELRGEHDRVRLFLYGAYSTTQGLHAVLLPVGSMYRLCFWLILLPTQNSDHIT